MESIITQHKPHFYQYMEIQLLQSYIQKGITFFVNSILNTSPQLVSLRYYSQQISLLIDFLKDFICLKKYGATYSEQFYSLQRTDLLQSKKGKNLKILYHTLVMTLIPYLLNKIDTYYNNLVEQQANQGKILNSIQKIITTLYPYIYAIFTTIQVLMKFRYLLQKQVKVYDLYYKISKTTLSYKQMSQQKIDQGKTHYPWMDLIKTPGLLAMMIGHKVLGWYFSQKKIKNVEVRKGNQIDRYLAPLSALLKSDNNYTNKNKKQYVKGVCMICSKPLENATVIKQNGHVFCYNCISQYVKQNGKCPITGIKVSSQNLQLIYSSG